MSSSRRALAVTLAVLALVLTAFGVLYAATDSNPSGASDVALIFHGDLRTAEMALVIDTGQRYALTGDVAANFTSNKVEATLDVPLFFSTATVTAIMAHDQIYLSSPSVQSAVSRPWVSIPYPTPDLFGTSLALADFKGDLFCLQDLGAVKVTKNGPYTVYSAAGRVPSAWCGLPPIVTRVTHAALSVTVARQGQVASATLVAGVARQFIRIHLQVLSYNRPVVINVPPPRQVQPLSSVVGKGLLSGQIPITRLLSPAGIRALV